LECATRIAAGREAWVSPSIGAALVAGYPWLDVYCPGCRTSRAVDIIAEWRTAIEQAGARWD